MSGVFQNIRGTSSTSFKISKNGATIYSGLGNPNVGPEPGLDGDLWLRKNHAHPAVYQYYNGVWNEISTLQTTYNQSADGKIVLNSTTGAVMLKDNATPITGSLFAVKSSNELTNYMSVSADNVNTDLPIVSRGDDVVDYFRRYTFFAQS